MNLTCHSLLSSTFSLNVFWSPPDDNENALTSYQVGIKKYVSGEDTEVTTDELREPYNREVSSPTVSLVITGLGEIPKFVCNAKYSWTHIWFVLNVIRCLSTTCAPPWGYAVSLEPGLVCSYYAVCIIVYVY